MQGRIENVQRARGAEGEPTPTEAMRRAGSRLVGACMRRLTSSNIPAPDILSATTTARGRSDHTRIDACTHVGVSARLDRRGARSPLLARHRALVASTYAVRTLSALVHRGPVRSPFSCVFGMRVVGESSGCVARRRRRADRRLHCAEESKSNRRRTDTETTSHQNAKRNE
jgi:hypothetical protein